MKTENSLWTTTWSGDRWGKHNMLAFFPAFTMLLLFPCGFCYVEFGTTMRPAFNRGETKLVSVDGQWTQWTRTMTCSVTCEVGLSVDIRTCQGRSGMGLPCPGEDTRVQNCDTGLPCPGLLVCQLCSSGTYFKTMLRSVLHRSWPRSLVCLCPSFLRQWRWSPLLKCAGWNCRQWIPHLCISECGIQLDPNWFWASGGKNL